MGLDLYTTDFRKCADFHWFELYINLRGIHKRLTDGKKKIERKIILNFLIINVFEKVAEVAVVAFRCTDLRLMMQATPPNCRY